jgi:hypothetical protein
MIDLGDGAHISETDEAGFAANADADEDGELDEGVIAGADDDFDDETISEEE